MESKKPSFNFYIIPMIILIGIIIYGALDELVLKPRKVKRAEQNLIVACVEMHKSTISLYRSLYGSMPISFESMIERLNENEEDRKAISALERCVQNTPLDYQRRINGRGYKINYRDAWGKEQSEEVDFDSDFE